jgi:hypothetical protein
MDPASHAIYHLGFRSRKAIEPTEQGPPQHLGELSAKKRRLLAYGLVAAGDCGIRVERTNGVCEKPSCREHG